MYSGVFFQRSLLQTWCRPYNQTKRFRRFYNQITSFALLDGYDKWNCNSLLGKLVDFMAILPDTNFLLEKIKASVTARLQGGVNEWSQGLELLSLHLVPPIPKALWPLHFLSNGVSVRFHLFICAYSLPSSYQTTWTASNCPAWPKSRPKLLLLSCSRSSGGDRRPWLSVLISTRTFFSSSPELFSLWPKSTQLDVQKFGFRASEGATGVGWLLSRMARSVAHEIPFFPLVETRWDRSGISCLLCLFPFAPGLLTDTVVWSEWAHCLVAPHLISDLHRQRRLMHHKPRKTQPSSALRTDSVTELQRPGGQTPPSGQGTLARLQVAKQYLCR